MEETGATHCGYNQVLPHERMNGCMWEVRGGPRTRDGCDDKFAWGERNRVTQKHQCK
eukprot:CAMPEP_0170589990 /NCGR_PEP_ID=MMETSP0224-20130122/11633_1 /TAXON_ID=285029 /ORGANISM="Togula jolla, Strain CCCM 725" /LENGTH=56 /DNA_ID=CAMNT_0010913761 /DNA_START=311 /DNA_END=478 /DNA_ORIENTATION=+